MNRALLTLGILAGASGIVRADSAPARPFANAAQDIEFFNVSQLQDTKRLLLPTLYLRVMHWSRSTTEDPNALPQEIATNLDPAALQQLAASLYDDLAEHLRLAGWEVVTQATLQNHAQFAQLAKATPDKALGVPIEEKEEGDNAWRHLVIAPPNMPVIQASATGPIWAMKSLLREYQAGAMIATYTFDLEPADPAAAAAEPAGDIPARLRLAGVALEFYSARLTSGWMRSRSAHSLADANIGMLAPATPENAPRAASPFKRALGSIGALSGRRKVAWVFSPAPVEFESAAARVARDFNASAVQTILPYAPKP